MKPPGREPSRPLLVQPGAPGSARLPSGDAQRAAAPLRRPGNLDQVPTTILLEHVTGRSRRSEPDARDSLRAPPQEGSRAAPPANSANAARRGESGPDRLARPLVAPATQQPPRAVEPVESGRHQLTTVRANPYHPTPDPMAPPEAVVSPAMFAAGPATSGQAAEHVASVDAAAGVGQVVAFFATHGGTGATTLACNGAAALARRRQATCLVDLDLQLGDALTVLGLEPKCAMSRLAHEMESFDWEMLEPMLPRHASGLSVVSQVGNLEELGELTVGRMPQVLRYLQGHFACVVVDGVRDFGDHALATLDVADRVVLVVTQGVSAVRGASRRLAIFRRLGYPASKIQIVVNRYSPRHPIGLAAFTEALGQAPVAVIPEDAATAGRAALKGLLLHEADAGSAIDGAIEGMIHGMFGLAAPTRPVARRWWSRRAR